MHRDSDDIVEVSERLERLEFCDERRDPLEVIDFISYTCSLDLDI